MKVVKGLNLNAFSCSNSDYLDHKNSYNKPLHTHNDPNIMQNLNFNNLTLNNNINNLKIKVNSDKINEGKPTPFVTNDGLNIPYKTHKVRKLNKNMVINLTQKSNNTFISNNTKNSNNNQQKKSPSAAYLITLPSLLMDKSSTKSFTGINTENSVPILRDEIKIRNSPRKINYDQFFKYKDIHTDDITFIKEKISYENTECNSTNVVFPQSYFDLVTNNLEKHKNFIRKRTKIDLSHYTSKLFTENNSMDVMNETVGNISKLQATFDNVKSNSKQNNYKFDYFSFRKYFDVSK